MVFHLRTERSHLTSLTLLRPKIQESPDSTFKKQRLQNAFLWGIIYIQWPTPVYGWLSLHECVLYHVTSPKPGHGMFPPPQNALPVNSPPRPNRWFDFCHYRLLWRVLKMPCPQNCAVCTSGPGFLLGLCRVCSLSHYFAEQYSMAWVHCVWVFHFVLVDIWSLPMFDIWEEKGLGHSCIRFFIDLPWPHCC